NGGTGPPKSPATTSTTTISATFLPTTTTTTPQDNDLITKPTAFLHKLADPKDLIPTTPPTNPRTVPEFSSPAAPTTPGDESTHGREAIELMEASGTDFTHLEEDDANAVFSPLMETQSEFIVLPNGVTVCGDEGGVYGNVALSSCPGKKVRLDTGPVNGRAAINRDLDSDFERLSSLNIKCVVCCLNDAELSYLGAPFPKYESTAAKYGMGILRIPIIEGSCPDTIEEVASVISKMDQQLRKGVNVLIHCRGGVGRAGLIACCLLLEKRFVNSATRAIQVVRIRRSLKAIETMRQEDFISLYEKFLLERLEAVSLSEEVNGGANESSQDLFEDCAC
ncbi:hypothetical protein HDU98_006590, partial [Podochytrium sp. JEL0797]